MGLMSWTLDDAKHDLDTFRAETEELYAALADIENDPDWTADAKRERSQEVRARIYTLCQSTNAATTERLDNAERRATERLRTTAAETPEAEARLTRAAMRVTPMLAAGRGPGEVAELLAENGDVDGIQALREQVPTWAGARFDQRDRRGAIENALEHVDRHWRPLASAEVAEAIDVRLGVAHQRERLRFSVEHAFQHSPRTAIGVALADDINFASA